MGPLCVSTGKCRRDKDFCMICVMRLCARHSFATRSRSYSPGPVVKNLKSAFLFRSGRSSGLGLTATSLVLYVEIAKHMRLGRQEDSHEFLRFCIDAMQAAALYGKSP